MKRIIPILILVMISSIYSCSEIFKEEYTQNQLNSRFVQIHCRNIFNCEEAVNSREVMKDKDSCREKMSENEEVTNCASWDEEIAYKCIDCLDKLGCSEYFDSKTPMKDCDSCVKLNDICNN